MSMTDEQIIEILGCCACSDGCENCPYSKQCDGAEHLTNALALIKRQQAEIENLKADKVALFNGQMALQKMYINAKAEAVRGFALKIKEKYIHKKSLISSVSLYDDIDELEKEMTEKEGGMG